MLAAPAKEVKGSVSIDDQECKGCGLCIEACVPKCLHLSHHLNRYGYHPAAYDAQGCTGCGLCFYACPEPGAIEVYKA